MPPDITGIPRWQPARETVARLRDLPPPQAEANVQGELHSLLRALFPALPPSELAMEKQSGAGPIDVYCRNVVFETKGQGKLDARPKPDGSTETPEEQAVRYLDALTAPPDLFARQGVGWRACVTDGREWHFYDYDPDAPEERRLTPARHLNLLHPDDDDTLLGYLYDFVNRTVKLAPPTDDRRWAEQWARPFVALAAAVSRAGSPAYAVKLALWRDLLQGAYITPPESGSAAERDLFARHTMLVVTARAVTDTIMPDAFQSPNRSRRNNTLTEGFAAWLLDAAGADGAKLLDDITSEINQYNWQHNSRDTLKDLYHAVIPRHIRHDFGEYYTPDWLARAVCEEVMDPQWRREVIDQAVAGQRKGPAVLDPSCGSGTFLYHAVQLLLEDARQHPELAHSPHALVGVVNGLVAGVDIHPVAVELSKTTKLLSFADLAPYTRLAGEAQVHLGDSLQWETRRNRALFESGELINIPTGNPDRPLQLPRSFLLSDQFIPRLNMVFDYARRPEYPGIERGLAGYLNLNTDAERETLIEFYRQIRGYIEEERNHVWNWYIANLMQPVRLSENQVSRLVGNPPWVVYNAMSADRQDAFRQQAQDRKLWAGANLATQNDLAATFVATCVDYYLQSGGKFGFVMPYATLRARHWAPFRTGQWTASGGPPALADLGQDAWDLMDVNSPPFPQANSSVIFGNKVITGGRRRRRRAQAAPLAGIQGVSSAETVNPRMSWDEVRPKLTYTRRMEMPTAPSETYADAFRNGATLFPQPLVVFEEAQSLAQGKVYFKTNPGKGVWRRQEREGQVEARFVKPALFSRLLLPFGLAGQSHIIAPFADDGRRLESEPPQGAGVTDFLQYWDRADRDWRQYSSPRPPLSLLDQVDYQGKLSSQLRTDKPKKVVYNSSGSILCSAVVSSDLILSHTLYWTEGETSQENHYLSAIFSARCLREFFRDACRASDRHFMLLPVQNLPIPRFDAGNEHHANLATQSQAAHARVAALVAERQAARRRINRNEVLNDPAMQPILAAIDAAARAILPDYCAGG